MVEKKERTERDGSVLGAAAAAAELFGAALSSLLTLLLFESLARPLPFHAAAADDDEVS